MGKDSLELPYLNHDVRTVLILHLLKLHDSNCMKNQPEVIINIFNWGDGATIIGNKCIVAYYF